MAQRLECPFGGHSKGIVKKFFINKYLEFHAVSNKFL
jgi:hypothetical protein